MPTERCRSPPVAVDGIAARDHHGLCGRRLGAAVRRGDIDWRHFAVLRTERGVQQLTRKQWALFRALHTERGTIVGDARLIDQVWPGRVPHDGQLHDLRVLIHALRCILAGSRWLIIRHHSRGYEMIRIAAPLKGRAQAENVLAIQT
jgi:hypothetical protein